jgi:hypothetical protein
LATRTCINLVSRVIAHTFEFSVSRSRSPPYIYYLGYPLGRFAGLKHRQLARQVGVTSTTRRIRRTLVNKINLLVDSSRYIEASRLAPVKAESIFLRRASGCFGMSRGSSLTTSTTLRDRMPRLVTPLVVDYSASRRLVVDYLASAARPGASARHAARHAARRAARRRLLRLVQARCRLLRLRRTSECLGTSCGSSRSSSRSSSCGSLSTISPRAGSYVAHPGASARCTTCRADYHRLLRLAQACRRLLRLRRATECLGTSCGSSSTT